MKPLSIAPLALTLFLTTAFAQGPATPDGKLPVWAYPDHFGPAAKSAAAPSPTEPQHLPGSKASYTRAEINNIFVVPDWYPEAHPAMPEVVAHGRKPDVFSCGH